MDWKSSAAGIVGTLYLATFAFAATPAATPAFDVAVGGETIQPPPPEMSHTEWLKS